nr:hypothetical protein CFP56_59700 [Quercus suber]
MVHTTLNSKEDFDAALTGNPGKYVFIYLHEGPVPDSANQGAAKFASTTVAYSADVSENKRILEYFKVSKAPAAVIYKDNAEVYKSEDMAAMKDEVAKILAP